MNILLTETINFKTSKGISEVNSDLLDLIDPSLPIPFAACIYKKSKPYQGIVNNDIFVAHRVTRYSFLTQPQIRGTIRSEGKGNSIIITMGFSTLRLSAVILPILIFGYIAAKMIQQDLLNGDLQIASFVGLALIAAWYLKYLFILKYEVMKVVDDFGKKFDMTSQHMK